MVQYGYYPWQVMVYMGMGVVWENLTCRLPVLSPMCEGRGKQGASEKYSKASLHK